MSTYPASPLTRIETRHSQKGFRVPDPFAPRQRPGASFVNALLATALFRCWHILLFFTGWATLISVLNHHGHKLYMQATLLTVIGTVLGFVISYRTTSSFERYNEGRRLWSQVIYASRTFARTVWFHVPDQAPAAGQTADYTKAQGIVEKKTVVNLLEAYAVSIKHYLRGEDGIYYKDLYYLVKFLPEYALPAGIPTTGDGDDHDHDNHDEKDPAHDDHEPVKSPNDTRPGKGSSNGGSSFLYQRSYSSAPTLPLPATATSPKRATFAEPVHAANGNGHGHANGGANGAPRTSMGQFLYAPSSHSHSRSRADKPPNTPGNNNKIILPRHDELFLLPARMPPKYHILDLFPFSLVVRMLTKRGKELRGRKAAKLRARMRQNAVSHNLPLEISLYLSSYVAALQNRKQADVPTVNTLLASLNQLVDALTGLERILTTPIPFSSLWIRQKRPRALPSPPLHLIITLTLTPPLPRLPPQNLDHFTNNIIRNELRAITSAPPPDPARWAFAPENDMLFANSVGVDAEGDRVGPREWVERGHVEMQKHLRSI
ncbi:hypothetical protein H0H81_010275 [Sphagnurus paluster]|uniref:Uncharacterized protein n=1 Tax=Sphagnurus paluster TaxID=117069 RepID=A0A9P7GND8_9AGAR|nr:hypothetical protein H0H81_010275 [Sphagnurus paluster]